MLKRFEGHSSELETLVNGKNPSCRLLCLKEENSLDKVYGSVAERLSSSELRRLDHLFKNIGQLRPEPRRRVGLLFTALEEKHAVEVVESYDFDDVFRKMLLDTIKNIDALRLTNSKVQLKKLISEVGWESFDYMHGIDKAENIVYNNPSFKLEAQVLMLKDIKNGEPVLVEDLAINAKDIIGLGMADEAETAKRLLWAVLSDVHKDPSVNRKEILLRLVAKYRRNKLFTLGRYINWIK